MKKKINTQDKLSASPEAVFDRYADMVYRLGFVRTKNQYDADDILQEVFLRYMKVWKSMQSEEHIKAMLIRITVNYSNSWLKAYSLKRTEQLNDNLISNEGIPEEGALAKVLELPIKYRTVIHLHYYMGYSVEEIAKIISAKPSTVKTQLLRGREKLKISLETEDL